MMIRALWPALASLGAGLVLFATAAGAAPAVAIPVGIAGAVELAWAFSVLRAGRLVMPRAAIVGGAVGIVGSGFLLLTGPVALVPFVALFVFHWSIAIAAVIELRGARARSLGAAATVAMAPSTAPSTASAPAPAPRQRRAGAFTIVLVIEAMLVAAIATPALAASEAGEFAVPHGTLHSGH